MFSGSVVADRRFVLLRARTGEEGFPLIGCRRCCEDALLQDSRTYVVH